MQAQDEQKTQQSWCLWKYEFLSTKILPESQ